MFKIWIDQIVSEAVGFIHPINKQKREQLNCSTSNEKWQNFWFDGNKTLMTCMILDQAINTERFDVETSRESKAFWIKNNKEVKFLPGNIAKSFPQLIVYAVHDCGIKILNARHFKSLRKLEALNLGGNEIDTVVVDSFEDLTELVYLGLHYNKIQFLDPKCFHHW